MQAQVSFEARKPGRPSRHPVVVRYHEATRINALIEQTADRLGLTFAEAQRRVNREGLKALGLLDA